VSRRALSAGDASMTLVPLLKPRRKWPLRLIKAIVAVGAVVTAFAAIEALTGWPSAAYRSLPHPHMRADAASAWATWATFVIAAIAAVFAYNQVKIAREARQEQAQPNVVMYAESTPSHWQFLDIVLKNFGTTPAYNVTVEITPELRESPAHRGAGITKVAFPEQILTLAPGQEIRTNWDHAASREDYMQELREQYERRLWAPCEFRERELRSRHDAVVRYEDSHQNRYEMRSTLDFDLLRDTTRVETNTVHDLTNRIKEQNNQIAKIATHLEDFGREHKGIWVYPSNADDERQYWAEYAKRVKERRAKLDQNIREAQARSAARKRGEQTRAVDETPPDEYGTGSTDDGTAKH